MSNLEAWATVAMCGATAWMAYQTRRMAQASQQALALDTIPHLAITGVCLRFTKDGDQPTHAQTGLKIQNPGKVLITFKVLELTGTLQDETLPPRPVDSSGGVIHPSLSTEYYLATEVWPPSAQREIHGTISFLIEFWATPDQRHKCKGELKFNAAVATGATTWMWIGWPIYS
ncbi:MAG: hypothetical protein WB646_13425 [Steroidobacteraceae bacterium]